MSGQGTAVVVEVAWVNGLAAIRSLGRRGLRVLAVDHRPFALGFRSRYAEPRLAKDWQTPRVEGAGDGHALCGPILIDGARKGQTLAVEFDLRERFYAHLQRLELSFFDTQQTGQLMSRATVDLQSIRFFLGYGLIFITQNLLTITLACAVMIAINPLLALIALVPAPFVVYTPDGAVDTAFPPTGKTFAVTQSHWFRIEDDKVVFCKKLS